jgi:hypothetical protein
VMRRTLSNAPLPARLLMPTIASRAFSRPRSAGLPHRDSGQNYGVVKPHRQDVHDASLDEESHVR